MFRIFDNKRFRKYMRFNIFGSLFTLFGLLMALIVDITGVSATLLWVLLILPYSAVRFLVYESHVFGKTNKKKKKKI
jgi:hypothetical protein